MMTSKPATGRSYLMVDYDGNRTRWTRITEVDGPMCELHLNLGNQGPVLAIYRGVDAPLEGPPDPMATPMTVCEDCLGDLISWVGDAHANVASVTEED
jgi:hypothetical protein